VRHHRSVAYSAELVLLNKHKIYGGTPKVNCYQTKKYDTKNAENDSGAPWRMKRELN